MEFRVTSGDDMVGLGVQLGRVVLPGTTVELVGDIGAGKTTFSKGVASALGVEEAVTSPTFTISREYKTHSGAILVHYDFYRLDDPGVMLDELADSTQDSSKVVLIEWSDRVAGVLPADRIVVDITVSSETERLVSISASGMTSQKVLKGLGQL